MYEYDDDARLCYDDDDLATPHFISTITERAGHDATLAQRVMRIIGSASHIFGHAYRQNAFLFLTEL